VTNLASVDSSTAQIFNCQMGRGRTTTGTAVATLLALRRWPEQGVAVPESPGKRPCRRPDHQRMSRQRRA